MEGRGSSVELIARSVAMGCRRLGLGEPSCPLQAWSAKPSSPIAHEGALVVYLASIRR